MLAFCDFGVDLKEDENLYHSDSDESLHQYRLGNPQPPPRPQSTLSLNQLSSRRKSNPDIYPGARRFSTSYSNEDILSNDQLDQIHFDPRYRDYRSASSLNYESRASSYNRDRSNSLNSGSGENIYTQYQQYRRLSCQSPPLPMNLLVPQKRWDTNPAIFIEEYKDDHSKSKTESKNSKESLRSSNESLPPLSESDIKSFCDLSSIPFIDEDPNDAAPCRFPQDDFELAPCGIMTGGKTCPRKSVSFDVIAGTSSHQHLFTNNGKNSPKNPHPITYPTDKNPLFHGSHRFRTNVRPSRDGINRSSHPPVSNKLSSCDDDHCTLVDKLIRLKLEENWQMCCKIPIPIPKPKPKPKLNYKIKWDDEEESRVCEGKVKALTTYFNSLPYLSDDCNCVNVHRSTPDLSCNKLTQEEMENVQKQLTEWSEFGLKKPSHDPAPCSFLERASSSPLLCLENEKFNECKRYQDVLNKLDKVELRRRKQFAQSLSNLSNPTMPDCFYARKRHHHHCHHECNAEKKVLICPPKPRSEKHKCRSPCYNIKDPAKVKKKKEAKIAKSAADDNESFIIWHSMTPMMIIKMSFLCCFSFPFRKLSPHHVVRFSKDAPLS